MIRRHCVQFLSLIVLAAAPLHAQTSYPMLMSLKPVAAQVGQTSEHTISSRYSMFGAYQVLVSGTGVTGEIVHPKIKEGEKPPNLTKMKVRFTVAPEAATGVRDFRIATPHGVSTMGQLVVARNTIVSEKGKNDKPDLAEEITVPATVCGTIERAEDVDFFRFKVDAGVTLSFHVRSMRLQNRIHDLQKHSDPLLTIRAANGSTLAMSDNYFFGDPFLSHRFDQAGEYLLELRDVRYQGNAYWEYSVEISDRPLVETVFPLGIARGSEVAVKLVQAQLPDTPQGTVLVDDDAPLGRAWTVPRIETRPMNPVPVYADDLPIIVETDASNDTAETAQVVDTPVGINGCIEHDTDMDLFAFDAHKGEKLSFEVIARRLQSGLDSQLRILNEKGQQQQLNDDLRHGRHTFADSAIENWTVPADGRYFVEIRDIHLRGGKNFVYYLRLIRSEPHFALFIDTDKTPLTPGTNGSIFVRIERKNGFTGAVQLEIEGLPEGVAATCGQILAGKGQDGCIVLEAAADAPQSVSNIRISGRAIGTEPPDDSAAADELQLTAFAAPLQETYLPGGGRGHWPVEMHTVSVGSASDILAVSISPAEITLKPGESKQVAVTIERAEGFTKNITLDMLYRHLGRVYGNSLPEGVTIDAKGSKTLLTGKVSQGHITLVAAKNAPAVERQQSVVMANIALNFVMKASYTSKPVYITVAE